MVQNEIEEIQKAIEALENQRALLGDSVVDTAVAPLHEKLAALEAADRPDQQRKLVTTLFLDVVNSTAMVRDMDPEDHLAIMDGAMQRLTEPIEANGGRVLKYMGDGLMALFGHPVARENEPEMAVRAALNMLALARDYSGEVEKQWNVPEFAVRIGMSTGMAIVGGGTEGENTVAGRHVNLAARLETAAPPGGLFISHTTYQQVRSQFDIEPQEPITAKGFSEPQAAYLVIRAKPRRFLQTPRGVAGVATRMIGRDSELSLLQESYGAVVEHGKGRLITIVGEAGIGKSRLLAEFAAWLEAQAQDVRIIQGKAYLQMQGAPFGLLRDLFTSEFAIQEDDSVEEVSRKFESGLASISDDAEEAAQKAHHIGQLLGFNFSASPYLEQALANPRHLRERALAYASDYVVTIAQTQIVAVFLEDLHWADSSSLDALAHVISKESNLPILVLAMTRPSLFQRVPDWGSKIGFHQRIDLLPLSGENSRLLVAEVLQNLDHVPDVLRDIIVNNAEGNPFYAEELIKILIEEGIILKTEPKWCVHSERIGEVHIPASLTGVIQARLDRLSPQDKVVIQQASVIGRTFWDDSVSYVYGGADIEMGNSAVADSLRTLQERELVFPQPHSRFAGTVERNFRHALLRDVAYESVLKRLRHEYHSLAADWLIENSGDRLGESSGLIGDHLAQSGRDEEAFHYLIQAARLAVNASANQEAIDYLLNALRLLENQPKTAELVEQKLDLLTQLGRLYYVVNGFSSREVLQTFEKAQTLIQKGGAPHQRFAVLQGLSGSAIGRGEWRKALAYAEQLLQMAEVSNHITLRLWAHHSLAMVNYHSGKIIAAKEHFDALLDLYDPERHGKQFRRIIEDPRLRALTYLSWIYWELGYPEKSTTYSETALLEAENLDHPFTMVDTLLTLALMHLFYRSPAEKVLEFTTRTMSLADKENVPDYWAWAAIAHGWALIKLGKPTGAMELMNRAFGSLLDRESKLSITFSLKQLSEAYQMMGELEKALEMAEYALVQAEETGERFLESELYRLKGDLQWQNNADPLEAETLYKKALEIAQDQQAKSFELRAAMSLARLRQDQGKTDEAHALLSAVYSWFTEGFDTADLQEARVLLDELA